MPTKAQLESEIEALKTQLKNQKEELLGKLGLVNAESSKLKSELIRAKNESHRYEGNFHQADGRLKAIARIIASTLEVAYQAGPEEEYSSEGKPEKPLAVRFLRHIFKLADTSVPF